MTAVTPKPKLKFILRRWVQRIHLATTLFFGVFIVLEILSGTLLMFKPELEALLHPKLYHVTPGPTVTIAEALKHIQASNPTFKVDGLDTPVKTGNVYRFYNQDYTALHVDPGTGQANGLDNGRDILDWLFDLHYSFFMPGDRPGPESPFSETWGRFSVGVIGVLLVLMLLTGLVLWWPGIKSRGSAFKLRRNNRFAWNYSIHKLIGVIVAVPLLVITLVMLPYSFGDYSKPVLAFLQIPRIPYPETSSSTSTGKPLSLDELGKKAEALLPGSRLISVYTYDSERSQDPSLPVNVTLTAGYDGALGTGDWGGNVNVQLDRYSGKVLAFQDTREFPFLAQAIDGQLWMGIHMGTWGGWTTRILEFVISIAGIYLAWTGIRQWWIKQHSRYKNRGRRLNLRF